MLPAYRLTIQQATSSLKQSNLKNTKTKLVKKIRSNAYGFTNSLDRVLGLELDLNYIR